MEFNDKFFIELAASFAAITTVWIYGNRSKNAPIVGSKIKDDNIGKFII